MKQFIIIIIVLITLLYSSGCVKTSDLEKRKAEELAQQTEADQTQEEEVITIEEPETEETEVVESLDVNEEEPVEKIGELELSIEELAEELKDSEAIILELEAQLIEAQEIAIQSSGPSLGNPLIVEATNVMLALSINDMTTVSLYVPSLSGLRLSPYQYVNSSTDIVLSQNDVANWLTLPSIYLWGSYDGTGDPINLSASAYFADFVYDYNYIIAPQIGQNTVLSNGNMINNIASAYPTASFVEFYFPGFDPQYGGMDWRSLTLVMENQGGYWKLVGIVHGQWTI